MRTAQHAAFSHQSWMHLLPGFISEILTVFAIVKCSERLQELKLGLEIQNFPAEHAPRLIM